MTQVHRGEVINAYRLFLGLMENSAERKEVLAEMCFAGLMDVQDRLLHNRSYTTGHKAYRARSTVEIGNALGWENARNVVYAGALDIAVGPRWYSTYEVACNYIKMMIEGEALHAVPYSGVSEAELAILRNNESVNQHEAAELSNAILRQGEIETLEALTRLLKAGKDPRRILDVLQVTVAQIVLETQDPATFNMPHHCYEYQNTLAWFYDNSTIRAGCGCCMSPRCSPTGWLTTSKAWVRSIPLCCKSRQGPVRSAPPSFWTASIPRSGALNGAEAIVWTQAYCDNLAERDSLVQRIALSACKMGNDPHNQEIAQCMLMDFGTNRQPDRDGCCWPPPITPPCIANTATRKSLRAASATPWG